MLKITFKRNSFWKRFVRFDLDTRDIGLNIENKSKKTVSSSEDASRFSRIHRNFVSTHDTLFIHIPFHTTLAELHMNQLTDQVLRDFCNDHAVIVEKTSDIE